MALNYKGTVDVLPTEGVVLHDAYYFTDKANGGASAGYRYCSAISSSITWTSYDPIQILKDIIYVKVWGCVGAPSDTANSVQFPELTAGCFAVDLSTGDFYAYQGDDGWSNAWTGTAVISL